MQLNFENRGGIRRLYAIPVADILRIRRNWGTKTVTPELRRRDRVIALPAYAGQSYSFKEEKNHVDQGVRYSCSISGVIPAHLIKPEESVVLSYGEWIVLHQDARGRIRMSGTIDIPLQYDSTSDTGSSSVDLNGESFTFSAVEEHESYECYIADILSL